MAPLLPITPVTLVMACFAPNPTFVLATNSNGTSSTNAASEGGSSGEPNPTSTTAPETTGTGSTSDKGTSTTTDPATSEPVTSTTATTGHSTKPATTGATSETGETDTGMEECGFPMVGPQNRYVHDFATKEPITNCTEKETYHGLLSVAGGDLTMRLAYDCTPNEVVPDIILGKNWPILAGFMNICMAAEVFWNHVDGECRIGAMIVSPWNNVNPQDAPPQFVAVLSPPTLPAEFPLPPTRALAMQCGCGPGMDQCCSPDDPGTYTLKPPNGPDVPSGDEANFSEDTINYHFKNIQSYIGPGCTEDPQADRHFDWFIERI